MCYAEGAQAAVWGQKACDFDRGLVDPQQRRLTGPERGDSRVRSEVLHVHRTAMLSPPAQAGPRLEA